MRRFVSFKTLLAFLILALHLLHPATVFAHTLKTDGPIGAVLHIDPEDDPIIGEPAYFFFEFKDKEEKFRAEDCDCVAIISKDGQELATQTLSADTNLTSSNFSYTFEEKGVYKIEVTGKPLGEATFKNFKLTYDLRVERTAGNQPSPGNSFLGSNFHFIALGLILVVFVVITTLGKRKTKQTNLKGTTLSCLLIILSLFLLFQYGNLHHLIPLHHQISTSDKHLPCCYPPTADLSVSSTPIQPVTLEAEIVTSESLLPNQQIVNSVNSRSPPL
jgi:hypothetical protein